MGTRWGEGRKIHHALTNETLYTVTTEGLPLAESLQYGRQVGRNIVSDDIPATRANA